MLLFRIINLNVSGVFVYLSYSPLFFIYFILCAFITFGLSIWSFFFDIITILILCILLLVSLFLLFTDIITDNLYGISEVVTLFRVAQYCFIWFILSEAALFFSFFWSAFALNLLITLEFNTLISVLPTMYSFSIGNAGFIFYWFYLDLFNIIINTCFLFFSGIFCNYFYICIFYKSNYMSIIFCFLSLITGFLFIWNQLWEFSLLTFTISTNIYTTNLFTIDLLHFSHVSLGVFFITLSLIKIINIQISNIKLVFLTCIILYWHFVDLVWFILLRFMYFGILCALFLI